MDESGRDDDLDIRRTGSGGLILDDRASRLYANFFSNDDERNMIQESRTPPQHENISIVRDRTPRL
jgi:hypothetical protein